jgi:hypothetical protein
MAHTLTVCALNEIEAHAVVAEAKKSNVFYGIDISLEPCEDGEGMPKRLSVSVTAETAVQASIGKGYILALVEG